MNKLNNIGTFFLTTKLGTVFQAIPWDALCKQFRPKRQESRGKKSEFELQGKIALQFLKAYDGLSDESRRCGSSHI